MEGRTVRPLSHGTTGIHTRAPTPLGALAEADSRKRPTGYPLVPDPAPQPTLRTRPLTSRVILHRSRTPPPAVPRNAAVEHPCSGGVLLSVTFALSKLSPKSVVCPHVQMELVTRSFLLPTLAIRYSALLGVRVRACKILHCNELTELRPSLSMAISRASI